MNLFKMTTKNNNSGVGWTKDLCVWGENIINTVPLKNRRPWICTDGVIHAYISPIMSILYTEENNMSDTYTKLWLAKGKPVVYNKYKDKVGCYTLTTVKQIRKPTFKEIRSFASIVFGDDRESLKGMSRYYVYSELNALDWDVSLVSLAKNYQIYNEYKHFFKPVPIGE